MEEKQWKLFNVLHDEQLASKKERERETQMEQF